MFDAIRALDRASALSAGDRKRRGVVYTPVALAQSMCEMLAPSLAERVLEPSCGRGVFVFALLHWQRERHGLTWEQAARWAERRLFAGDLDPLALADLAELWAIHFRRHGVRSDFSANLRAGDALFEGYGDERFDAVLGNPPYVRIQNLPASTREAIRDRFSSCAKGNVDLYYAFCEKALDVARRVSFVVPNSLLSNASAKALREKMAPRLTRLIDFGTRRIFAPASAYACVFLVEPLVAAPSASESASPPALAPSSPSRRSPRASARSPSDVRPMANTGPKGKTILGRFNLPEEGGVWRALPFEAFAGRDGRWSLSSLSDPSELSMSTAHASRKNANDSASPADSGTTAKFSAPAQRLGDLADVFMGFGTNGDRCFLLPPGHINATRRGAAWAFKDPLAGVARSIDLALCPRVLKLTKVRDKAAAIDPLGPRIVCPYDVSWSLIPEKDLPTDALGWFSARRAALLARDKGQIDGYDGWHAFGRRQGFFDFAPADRLLLVPAMASSPLSPIDVRAGELGGRFVFTSGFVVRAKNPADTDRVAAFLRSDACWAQLLRAGRAWTGAKDYRSFGARLLRDLSVPAPSAAKQPGNALPAAAQPGVQPTASAERRGARERGQASTHSSRPRPTSARRAPPRTNRLAKGASSAASTIGASRRNPTPSLPT
ncbi:hypothetical protein Bcep1808_2116 [Burkholderia vietnamiensis G4]|uniref:site-specific DNA-methyltransferase (adenine-specific) n=1 Tax=Burkholderia vietnamiensis (strain G4 / LMG 22486) TaxID=269482 RepID=A4JFR5_BURVG|nr:hypothetical protein Bcep1808_2116 [Burkholderia vietnamiensis G4]